MIHISLIIRDLILHHHILVISNIWWRLLVTLIVAESHGHLVHIQGPVQMVQTILLKIMVQKLIISTTTLASVPFDVQIHFHIGVPTVVDGA